jgi:hypothetical protein
MIVKFKIYPHFQGAVLSRDPRSSRNGHALNFPIFEMTVGIVKDSFMLKENQKYPKLSLL